MYREAQICMGKCLEVYTSNISSDYSTRWWNFIIFCLCFYNDCILYSTYKYGLVLKRRKTEKALQLDY